MADITNRKVTTLTSDEFPKRVGVLGGGRMGAGIAQAFVLRGADVVVISRDGDSSEAARSRVESSILKAIDRGHAESLDEISPRLSFALSFQALVHCDLVIEAVPEDLNTKTALLHEVERHLNDKASLSTTTSSISISRLAANLKRPQDFLGLHFFNPVPTSRLIEIVVGEQTRPTLVEQARSWTEQLGKTAVVVKDAPGFTSSRLGVTLALEAMRMVEEGIAQPHDIDQAMILGYGHASGPLRTTDIVGLDVRLGIAEHLESHYGSNFAPPQILRDKVARGELGRKSGRGFFDWT